MTRLKINRIGHHELAKAAGHLLAYAVWILGFRLLLLTLITYFHLSSTSRFQEISDSFASNELMMMGVGSLLYVLLLSCLNPMTSITFHELFTPHRFERRFAPGFLHGAVLASGVTLAFLLSGLYKYLGSYIQFEDASLSVLNIVIRIAAIGAMVYCEEFIFRYKILNYLRRQIPDLAAVFITAIAFCAVKALQFDLGFMHAITLFLLSLILGIRALQESDFLRGAGLLAGLLIVFHPLLSLPVFGNEFQGVVMVKYQAASETESETFRMLTGGAGGPLSSFALQFLFLFDLGQRLLRNKKILLAPSSPR